MNISDCMNNVKNLFSGKPQTKGFSDFMLKASPEQKKEVFKKAAEEANREQREVFKKANA